MRWMRSKMWPALTALALAACAPANPITDQDFSGGASSLEAHTIVNADDFIEGNLYFLAFHEMGHALVSEFGLPIAGREEDAVDRLATWIMTPVEADETPEYLIGAMQGWFLWAGDTPLHDLAWWDEHGNDQQRAYQIACLLYGDAPERFVSAADLAGIPEERRETCIHEAADNDYAWSSLLAPYTREEGSRGADASITLRYAPTENYASEADYLRDLGVLDAVKDIMLDYYAFEPGIILEGAECEDPNAFWSSDTRTLTLCYELVADIIARADDLPAASDEASISAP